MGHLDDLPPLREMIEAAGLTARKALGQNFLFDLNLTGRIARSAGPLSGFTIVEIGPGPGGLTRALLAEGAEKVVAIERDPRCLAILQQIADHYPGRLEVIEADATHYDVRPHLDGMPARIIANLPYNVGTELLTSWLATPDWPPWFASLTLMFQREVAERIVATPAQRKDYGRLGVLCGWRTEARIMFNVPPSAFTPPPSILSSVVHLVPRSMPLPCNVRTLERVTAAAFGQRRKMLRQSLRTLPLPSGSTLHGLLEMSEINGTLRAEELTVADFAALANALDATGQS